MASVCTCPCDCFALQQEVSRYNTQLKPSYNIVAYIVKHGSLCCLDDYLNNTLLEDPYEFSSLLPVAAKFNHCPLARYMIERFGYKPDRNHFDLALCLEKAAYVGDLGFIQWFSQNFDIDFPYFSVYLLLKRANEAGHMYVLQWCLDNLKVKFVPQEVINYLESRKQFLENDFEHVFIDEKVAEEIDDAIASYSLTLLS